MKKFLLLILFAIIIPIAIFSQWSNRVKLSTNGMKTALNEDMGPCLAVSNDSVHVVWSDHRTQGYAIYYKHSLDSGLTWNNAVAITDTMGRATMPVVAVSGKSVHVVWMDSLNGIRCSYYIRSLDGGNTWGQKVLIDANTLFWPSVAANGNLVIVALNEGTFGVNTEVWITRSMDNGITWNPEQQISNASGRSEDQAIEIQGSQVHMSWNDNRTGTMLIEYRHSYDGGITWGPETAVTNTKSYTTMVSVNDTNTDIVYGINGSNLDVGLVHSSDSGLNFSTAQQLTNAAVGEAYPYMTRDGMNMHIVYMQFGSPGSVMYIHSTDGGVTWVPAIQLDFGGQPFIAYNGCTLHAIYSDSSAIYYQRNPTGNGVCSPATNVAEENNSASVNVFPNPFSTSTAIQVNGNPSSVIGSQFILYDVFGREVFHSPFTDNRLLISRGNLASGVYFYKLSGSTGILRAGKVVIE